MGFGEQDGESRIARVRESELEENVTLCAIRPAPRSQDASPEFSKYQHAIRGVPRHVAALKILTRA